MVKIEIKDSNYTIITKEGFDGRVSVISGCAVFVDSNLISMCVEQLEIGRKNDNLTISLASQLIEKCIELDTSTKKEVA